MARAELMGLFGPPLKTIKDPREPPRGGGVLTVHDLPTLAEIGKWTAYLKCIAIESVDSGMLTRQQAIVRWNLVPVEFDQWFASYKAHGLDGLRMNALQASAKTPETGVELPDRVVVGNVELTTEPCTTRIAGKEVHLARMQFRCLLRLCIEPGCIVTRLQLYDFLYGDRENSPHIKIMEVLVSKIRNVLKDSDATVRIETIHGRGLMVQDVTAPS